jgi:hypothetical protein
LHIASDIDKKQSIKGGNMIRKNKDLNGGAMKKSIVLLLLSLVVIVMFTSCGGGSTSPRPRASVGDIISFGGYEWLVLDVDGRRAKVVSQDIWSLRRYHGTSTTVTWATSHIRSYLNNDFFMRFTASDRARIVETTVLNQNNQWFGTNGGVNIADKIFLLSIEEVVRYFGDSSQLSNRLSGAEYINDRYNRYRIARYNGTARWWWLRSPGGPTEYIAVVDEGGFLRVRGYGTCNTNGGIRPALWLNL